MEGTFQGFAAEFAQGGSDGVYSKFLFLMCGLVFGVRVADELRIDIRRLREY